MTSRVTLSSRDVIRVLTVDDATNTITFTPALEFDYLIDYGLTPYAQLFGLTSDRTTVNVIQGGIMTADAVIGDRFVTVEGAAIGAFAVGDMVEIDDETTTPNGNNPTAVEPNRVIGINEDGANTLRLEFPIGRPFLAASLARVSVVDPVRNSTATGLNMTYRATSASTLRRHMSEINYGLECAVRDSAQLNEGQFGNRGNGFRITRSLNCETENCTVVNPKWVGSGEGYGCTIYYSRSCRHINFRGHGCRHTVLFQGGTGNGAIDVVSVNSTQADIDFHGVGEYGCYVDGAHITSGPTFSGSGKNVFVFGNTAHGSACVDCSISNFKVRNYQGTNLNIIKFQAGCNHCSIRDGEVDNVETFLRHTDSQRFPSLGHLGCGVYNVEIRGCANHVVNIDGGANGSGGYTCQDLIMQNITMRDCPKLFKLRQASGLKFYDITIENEGTNVSGSTPYLIDADNCPDMKVRKLEYAGV